MNRSQLPRKAVHLTELNDRIESLEKVVSKFCVEISNSLSDMRRKVGTTLQQHVGDKIMRAFLQQHMLEGFPVAKDKMAEFLVQAVEDAVKEYTKGEVRDCYWDIDNSLEWLISRPQCGPSPMPDVLDERRPDPPAQESAVVTVPVEELVRLRTELSALKGKNRKRRPRSRRR